MLHHSFNTYAPNTSGSVCLNKSPAPCCKRTSILTIGLHVFWWYILEQLRSCSATAKMLLQFRPGEIKNYSWWEMITRTLSWMCRGTPLELRGTPGRSILTCVKVWAIYIIIRTTVCGSDQARIQGGGGARAVRSLYSSHSKTNKQTNYRPNWKLNKDSEPVDTIILTVCTPRLLQTNQLTLYSGTTFCTRKNIDWSCN